ncbi:MAG TPA: hypothetical protein VMW38_15060 [Terriglobia bacterium]|nr:hypothetical protein [Terriglobia bacterium]
MPAVKQIELKERKDWLRRFNRKVTNPVMMTFAGRRVYTIIDHVGKHSKNQYHTPVLGQPGGNQARTFFSFLCHMARTPIGVSTFWRLVVVSPIGMGMSITWLFLR